MILNLLGGNPCITSTSGREVMVILENTVNGEDGESLDALCAICLARRDASMLLMGLRLVGFE